MSTPLVGSITVLIVLITTFLAYNANHGLPWVPSQTLTVEVKNAANIVPGNEVRIGGTRVGIVSKERAKRYKNGAVTALLDLKLDQGTAKIPVDSTVLIRARSLLGLKYVQITLGKDKKDFAWGTAVPLKNATPDPVEIDQLLNTFDDPTRVGIVQTVTAFGDALGGRGGVLGQLIDDAGPLTDNFVPVGKVLANEQSGLVPFLAAASRFTSELAAAGNSTGGLFRDLDRTTGALARADAALDQTLVEAPDALTSTAASLRATRPLIEPHIQLASDLRPGIRAVADGASDLAAASKAGVTGLAGTPKFSRDFVGVLDRLDSIGNSSVVARGLDGLTQFSKSSQPLVEGLNGAQTVCGYASLLVHNVASASSGGDLTSNWIRIAPYVPAYAPNGESVSATTPANGVDLPAGAFAGSGDASRKAAVVNSSYLHSNPQPVVGQNGRCEPGYETLPASTSPGAKGIVVSNPAGGTTTPRKTVAPPGSDFAPSTTPKKDSK